MEEKRTSNFSNGLIWFGAAVSIAEILTGTLLAPLGLFKGMCANLLGHAIGCVLLYFAGLIGAKTRACAMDTVKISFGEKGASLFSGLNILQLVGWTAVMIISGASAISAVVGAFGGTWLWSILIGLLIILWIVIGVENLGVLNTIAMSALFILTLVLSVVVVRAPGSGVVSDGMSFGAAVELSIAMPLSWLPLISDYTMHAKNPKGATLTSAIVYFFASSWMYFIGLAAAIFAGSSDIATILLQAGLGIVAVVILLFSTVTTTFLDAYSAGVSFESIVKKGRTKLVAALVTILGVLLAIFTPITKFEDFLYLIGSVFAPMIAILIVDYFILKKDGSKKAVQLDNLVLWGIGFVLYRVWMHYEAVLDIGIGYTIPVMVIVGFLCYIKQKLTTK